MEKINIAELLKDCPSGMELDCTMWDNLYFDRVEKDLIHCYYESDGYRNTTFFYKNGCYTAHKVSKCVIYPKGKTTWEGFQRPFKDGDVVVCVEDNEEGKEEVTQMFILKHQINANKVFCHTGYDFRRNSFFRAGDWDYDRLATEEEKQKLFETIKANGYKWNPETKTLEKLVIPKFKVGDKIKYRCGEIVYRVVHITEDSYVLDNLCSIPISIEHMYNLVPNKFDITTLKPFDKVLVRYGSLSKWSTGIFSHTVKSDNKLYFIVNTQYWEQCIPYEGNEHLLGTTNDCNEYYKTWE